ncbi:MAG TPA: glycosyltransferase [Spirochaetia bacterium]|nr:glycosyltransferase [Spirochaetia bacterium]
MNIGILKESLAIGGTERSAANISKALAQSHSVYMMLYDAGNIKYSYGGEVINFNRPPKKTFAGKILNSFVRDIKLRSIIKAKKINILYTFTAIGNLQTRLKYKNVIKIISARDYGKMSKNHESYHKALNNSDAMICNSNYIKEFYVSLYPEHKDRVFSVYNIIDSKEIIAQSKEQPNQAFMDFLSEHPQTIVSVGRFCPEKGFEYMLEAFSLARKNNPRLGLVLVGDGELKGRYLEIIEKLCIKDYVFFTGYQKNPYKYLARCSAFVLSSVSEGFPNVLAEAMTLRLPVIAANCLSGPAEILRNDMNYDAVKDRFELCDYGIITPRFTNGDNAAQIRELSCAIDTLLSSPELMTRYAELSEKRAAVYSGEAAGIKLNEIFDMLKRRR